LLHFDSTARKLLEERLETLLKEKTRWIAMAAHDLRNPVSAIMANSQLIEQELTDASAVVLEPLRSINSSGQFLIELLDDLLDLSAIESGAPDFKPEPTDIRSLVADSISLVSHLATRKGICIEACYADRLPALNLERRQMTQVLFNLLGNAIKFCPEDARVNITVRQGSADIVIDVQDNGPGIPRDGLEAIFIPSRNLHRLQASEAPAWVVPFVDASVSATAAVSGLKTQPEAEQFSTSPSRPNFCAPALEGGDFWLRCFASAGTVPPDVRPEVS
jgi:signal transduction histidine kinase